MSTPTTSAHRPKFKTPPPHQLPIYIEAFASLLEKLIDENAIHKPASEYLPYLSDLQDGVLMVIEEFYFYCKMGPYMRAGNNKTDIDLLRHQIKNAREYVKFVTPVFDEIGRKLKSQPPMNGHAMLAAHIHKRFKHLLPTPTVPLHLGQRSTLEPRQNSRARRGSHLQRTRK